MRICIVTVYNSLNCGSFLQAFALMKVLQKQGHEVVFLDAGIKNPGQYMAGTILGSLLTLKFTKAMYEFTKWRAYVKAQQVFRTIPNRADRTTQCDLFIFGSDEIWNAGRKSFAKRPVLWGQGIEAERRIAYAPSINRSTLAQLQALRYPEKCLEKFQQIMVRDEHTKAILSQLTSRAITTVIDPTLLLDSGEYQQPTAIAPIPREEYVLLYAYGSRKNKTQIENIRKFAKAKKLKIVSANDWFSWCDINIAATPFEFVELVKNAKYVITETFHGTVFSLIMAKPFVSYTGDNIKVIELLALTGLQSRQAQPDDELQPILDAPIDYDKVQQVLAACREKSLNLLLGAISTKESV